MVKDILNELNIHCIYIDTGCQEILQLQHLERHEATCGFTPAVCTNQGCGATLNQRDLIHHQSELCEFRKLKCHSCGEMTKTLANMEERMATTEARIANVEKNMERNAADMEGKLEAVNNEVRGLKTALIEGFDEIKDVLVEMKEENTRKVRNTASGDKENIIVAGGVGTDSVEMFNWRQRTWSPCAFENVLPLIYAQYKFYSNNNNNNTILAKEALWSSFVCSQQSRDNCWRLLFWHCR
jgi:hypothetical protein